MAKKAKPVEETTTSPLTKEERQKLKADNFTRLAQKRLTRLSKYSEQIIALSNRGNYSCSEKQAEELKSAVADMATRIINAFDQKPVANGEFKFTSP